MKTQRTWLDRVCKQSETVKAAIGIGCLILAGLCLTCDMPTLAAANYAHAMYWICLA